MASKRLAVWMKEQIQARLLEHAFSIKIMDLIADQAAFARRVYDDVVPPAMQVRLEELPDGWVPQVTQVSVQFGDESRNVSQIDFSGRIGVFDAIARGLSSGDSQSIERITRRIPYRMRDSVVKVYEVGSKLQRDWEDLVNRRVELSTKIKDAEKVIEGTLDSFTTVNALINGWPEVEPFAAKYRAEPPSQLPAVPRATLNSMLDLPAEETAS